MDSPLDKIPQCADRLDPPKLVEARSLLLEIINARINFLQNSYDVFDEVGNNRTRKGRKVSRYETPRWVVTIPSLAGGVYY